MKPLSLERLALPLAPVLGIGVLVLALAAWLAGSPGALVAGVGVAAAVAILLVSELAASLLGIERPLERMLFTMLVRCAGGAVAVAIGVLGAGAEPKLVALVALPIYLSLLAGEVIGLTSPTGEPNTHNPAEAG